MKWLILLFILLMPGGLLIYVGGCWLLGLKPWDLLKEMQPDMYDGSEPYERWLDKQRHD